jgi:hypothetical protein
MATAKKSNYTPEETLEIVSAWGHSQDSGISTNGLTIEQLVAKFENKWEPKQLIAKLSHEGVYKAKPKTKNGKKAVRKDALSDAIGVLCSMSEPDAVSLEKSNKGALLLIISTIEEMQKSLTFYEAEADETEEAEEVAQ